MERLGGALALVPLRETGWPVSDDTVQHMATLQALIDARPGLPTSPHDHAAMNSLMERMAFQHVKSWGDMEGRAPGKRCGRGVQALSQPGARWDTAIPYEVSEKPQGCGAAMRAMGIGAVYCGEKFRDALVAVASESAALSHHTFAGCASAVVSAAGCALSCEGVPVEAWPKLIVEDFLPRLERYLLQRPASRRPAADEVSWQRRRFAEPWLSREARMTLQQIRDPEQRDHRYGAIGGGWDALSSVFIAYEALRLAQGSWEQLVHLAGAHGGDSDSTLAIAGAWFGAAYGLGRTPKSQWAVVEKLPEICEMATALEQVCLAPVAPEAPGQRRDVQRASATPPPALHQRAPAGAATAVPGRASPLGSGMAPPRAGPPPARRGSPDLKKAGAAVVFS
uniref:ADP-ribosylhydrolase ARH1 n=1 Tax=Alexandrium monilatum TaxID=311494 RepID=A0A7S4SSL6_9DINO